VFDSSGNAWSRLLLAEDGLPDVLEGGEDGRVVARRVEREVGAEEVLHLLNASDAPLHDHLHHGAPEVRVRVARPLHHRHARAGILVDGLFLSRLPVVAPTALVCLHGYQRPEGIRRGWNAGSRKCAPWCLASRVVPTASCPGIVLVAAGVAVGLVEVGGGVGGEAEGREERPRLGFVSALVIVVAAERRELVIRRGVRRRRRRRAVRRYKRAPGSPRAAPGFSRRRAVPPRRGRRGPRCRRLAPPRTLLPDAVPRRHRRRTMLQEGRVGADGAAAGCSDGGPAGAVHGDVHERRASCAAAVARAAAGAVDLGPLVRAGRAEVRRGRRFFCVIGLGEADEGRGVRVGRGGAGRAREDLRQPLLQPAPGAGAGAVPAVGALVHEGRVHRCVRCSAFSGRKWIVVCVNWTGVCLIFGVVSCVYLALVASCLAL
jgi:hypothetical protein